MRQKSHIVEKLPKELKCSVKWCRQGWEGIDFTLPDRKRRRLCDKHYAEYCDDPSIHSSDDLEAWLKKQNLKEARK